MAADRYCEVKINGVQLPSPSDYQVELNDLDSENSKRYVTTGKMRRKRIRKNVLSITLKWDLLSMPEVKTLINLCADEQSYTATIYIPDEGINGTKVMYSNKKSYSYKAMYRALHKAKDFTFTMTEE